MSNRVSQKALRGMALVGIIAGAAALSGCTALGSRTFADKTVTGSTGVNAPASTMQPMPNALMPTTRVAAGPFVPPSDIGGSGSGSFAATGAVVGGHAFPGSVSSTDLPVISASTQGSSAPMSAPSSSAAVQVASQPAAVTASPNLVAVPKDAYVHVIESGESLYTIARRYDVTAQAIIQANGFTSPDKIYVGQKIVIPGRPDLLTKKGPASPVTGDEATTAPVEVASIAPNGGAPIAQEALATETETTQVAAAKPLQQPAVEPTLSGADKFRWPVSGRVITDFGPNAK